MNQKTFVLPTFGVTLTNELATLMTPLALAIAVECEQLESVSQERRSAFVELGCDEHLRPAVSSAVLRTKSTSGVKPEKNYLESPRRIKDVLADDDAPQSLKDAIAQTMQDLEDGKIFLS